jgi:hypothetical protein
MLSIFMGLIQNMTINPGATDKQIEILRKKIPFVVPDDFINFLKFSNGAEGKIGNHYLVIWRVQDLFTLNQSYAVEKFAPGFFLIGSDGGDEGYGYDFRDKKLSIVNIPFIDMHWINAKIMSDDFLGFLRTL